MITTRRCVYVPQSFWGRGVIGFRFEGSLQPTRPPFSQNQLIWLFFLVKIVKSLIFFANFSKIGPMFRDFQHKTIPILGISCQQSDPLEWHIPIYQIYVSTHPPPPRAVAEWYKWLISHGWFTRWEYILFSFPWRNFRMRDVSFACDEVQWINTAKVCIQNIQPHKLWTIKMGKSYVPYELMNNDA